MSASLLRVGKVRNAKATYALGFAVAAFAYVVHWLAWTKAEFGMMGGDVSVAQLLAQPDAVMSFIAAMYEEGSFTIGGVTPLGAVAGVAVGHRGGADRRHRYRHDRERGALLR